MAKTSRDKEMSQRLRGRIERRFPQRGRFRELEEVSAISASRWKNFFYGRTEAAKEMVDFWCNKFPDEYDFLIHGVAEDPESEDSFGTVTVLKDRPSRTIAERLTWVIFEWASPSGEQLFSYLEEKSNGTIPAEDWKQVIINAAPPSAAMVEVVGDYRPHFIEWIIRGVTTGSGQVDPTDKQSIHEWNARLQDQWNRTLNALSKARQPQGEAEK